jgi:hypothetical protein
MPRASPLSTTFKEFFSRSFQLLTDFMAGADDRVVIVPYSTWRQRDEPKGDRFVRCSCNVLEVWNFATSASAAFQGKTLVLPPTIRNSGMMRDRPYQRCARP